MMEADYGLKDELDVAILMHRESHFAGDFSFMIDYYSKEGIGIQPEFPLQRIEQLAALEQENGMNLAPFFLTGADSEKVGRAKAKYQQLREIFEVKKETHIYPRLIAELILTEEEEPLKEIAAIVKQGEGIVPPLLQLLENEDMADPLFPGYGLSPRHALTCLEKIGSKGAIIALFERIGHHDFEDEQRVMSALKSMGNPAKNFLLRLLASPQPNSDSERAAIALLAFDHDEEIGSCCLELLEKIDLRSNEQLSCYLLLGCQGLKSQESRQRLIGLGQKGKVPTSLKSDYELVVRGWQKEKTKL